MNVLVTGGAGYVGTLLTRALLEAGHRVTVYDSFMYGYGPLLHLADWAKLSVVRGDIRAISRADMRQQDVVYHLAAISGYTACEADPATAWEVNADGTMRVTKALSPGQLLVYASTTSIYGPPTLYARSKAAGEDIAMQRANTIAFRWATLFGPSPRMRHELLPNAFCRDAVRRGHIDLFSPGQRRTFMPVWQAALTYASVLTHEIGLVGSVWDVGDAGLTCTKAELAAAVQRHVPTCTVSTRETPDADARDIDVDFSRARARGLCGATQWSDHLPALVRLYGWCDGEGE